jgi:nickel/cobalt transporter (NiCoT) family protein
MGAARGIRRMRKALERESIRIAILAAAILAMYAVGIALLATFAPGHEGFAGTVMLAYTLGLRHGFDADHIAAIDNTTRKLRHSHERRPLGVGFFFSLGHSTVVLALTIVGALVTHAVPNVGDSTSFIGASVSGIFLWVVGLLNLAVLMDILRVAARMRAGTYDEDQLEHMLVPRGLLMRLGLNRLFRFVSRSWQMLPVGLLFGLGFETATEVALLALGAGAAVAGLPFAAMLCLPIMFAAGMSTIDTIDGVLMAHAYDWALRRPVRKIFYNITITTLSVIVALLVGTVQLLHVAISLLDLQGGLWSWIAGLDFQVLGYAMAGLFLSTWLVSLLLWRMLRIEQRWAPLTAAGAPTGVGDGM